MASADGGAGEAYYRTHADALGRDNALLRERVDKLEKANRLLMRSVYELSAALSAAAIPPPPLHLLPDEDAEADAAHAAPTPAKLAASEEEAKKAEAVAATLTTAATPPAVSGDSAAAARLVLTEKSEWGGHRGAVYALAFAPTGRLLAAAGFDRAVRLWDVAKNELGSVLLDAHAGPIADVGWSADGSEVLTGGLDARVKSWDAAKSRISGQWELGSFVAQLALHPPEPHLFAACGGERGVVLLFDRRAPVPARRLHDGDAPLGAVTFTRGGELVSGDAEGTLRLWDARREGLPLRRWSAAGEGGARGASVTNVWAGGAATEAECLLVNAYDSVRLWRRGGALASSAGSGGSGAEGAAAAESGAFKAAHTLHGVKGRHWPIRGSLQASKDGTRSRLSLGRLHSRLSHRSRSAWRGAPVGGVGQRGRQRGRVGPAGARQPLLGARGGAPDALLCRALPPH